MPFPPQLENLENLSEHLRASAAELGLAPELTGWLVAAGAQAFSAVCLSGVEGPARVEAAAVRGELRLRLEFPLAEPGRMLGLASSLFCPPAAGPGWTS